MSKSYDIPRIVIKLSGADVMEIGPEEELEAAAIEIEIRQYHKDFQDPERVQEEADWPGLLYEVIAPILLPSTRRKR